MTFQPTSWGEQCSCTSWCKVGTLQDAFCGKGLSLVESRDDDSPRDATEGGSQMMHEAGSKSFMDDKLKTFSGELMLAQTVSMSNKSSGIQGNSNPAMVSKLDGMKVTTSTALLNSNGLGVETSRYEQFMSSVDLASKAYGPQSIHVADLYVSMGIECVQNDTDTRSKELALLLLKEAFGIYQAEAGDSHERTVDCRIHLGKAHHSLGLYDEALDCFCMALYMREALLGEPHHPSLSEIWSLISSVHRAQSKLKLSLKASAKTLTGYGNAYGGRHPIVIEVLQTMAGIHIEMGNLDKAADIQKYVRLYSLKSDDMKAEF